MPLRIIHIEDNAPDAELTRAQLETAESGSEFTLEHYSRLKDGLGALPADAVLLDLSLPDVDGLEGLKAVTQKFPNVPVIVATGNRDKSLALEALKSGAQDYVTKGEFDGSTLMRSLLFAIERMKAWSRDRDRAADELKAGDFVFHPSKQKALLKGQELPLTPLEFKLLLQFARNPERVFTRDELVKHLWGTQINVVDRTVDTHVSHLRQKIAGASSGIHSVRGVGYRFGNGAD